MAVLRRIVSSPPARLAVTVVVVAACDFVRDNEPIAPRADEPVVQVVVVAGTSRAYAVVDHRTGSSGVQALALSRDGAGPSSFEPLPPEECATVATRRSENTSCLAVDLLEAIREGDQVTLSGSTTAGEAISGTTEVPERPRLDPGSGDTIRVRTTESLPVPRGRAELIWTTGPTSAASTISVVAVRVERADGSRLSGCHLFVSPAENALLRGGHVTLEMELSSALCTDAVRATGTLVLASVDSAFAAFHRAVSEGTDRLPFGQFGIVGAHGLFGSMAPSRLELSWRIAGSTD